jgi:hypothetical protein
MFKANEQNEQNERDSDDNDCDAKNPPAERAPKQVSTGDENDGNQSP